MITKSMITIDVEDLYTKLMPNSEGKAKLCDLGEYIAWAKELAGAGKDVVLRGRAPVWLFLAVSHALREQVRSLYYDSWEAPRLNIYNQPF